MTEQAPSAAEQMPMQPRIAACIVCRNEADKLEPCLKSVTWVDEIVVLDLSSSDGSGEVAAAHGARVIVRDPVPIVELVRNEVAAAADAQWILALDPDERVGAELPPLLRELSRRGDLDGAAIAILNHDFGFQAQTGVHRHDRKPRFYRKDRVTWPTLPNALPEIAPERLYLVPLREQLSLIHDRNRTIVEALERVIRYAPAEAQSLLDAGETFTARRMVTYVGGKFYRQFVHARSLDEGVPGLVRGFVLASFHFYVWACFWQLSGAPKSARDDRFLRRLGLPLRLLELAMIPGRIVRRHRARLGAGRQSG